MSIIDVILLRSLKKSGRTYRAGDVVSVARGYFRYLLKAGLACRATKEAMESIEEKRKILHIQDEQEQETAQTLMDTLASHTFVIARKAGDVGIFGSVTASDIVRLLEEKGISLARTQLHIPAPIKSLGMHSVTATLHPKVIASFSVEVRRA